MKKKKVKATTPGPEAVERAPSLREVEEHDRSVEPVDPQEPPRLPFTVVGIGASAGGLEAFQEFFDAMPPDSGMAFVLVQHLPPDRESLVAEILAKHTRMPVQQIRDGMRIEADHVYVIRPGHTLTLLDGVLHLGAQVERPRHGRPVDDFFRSLAEEQRERSVCVILSGMGSNGTAGAQEIKAVGGLCIAQEPDSAQFPSMPRHLIDAGYSDFILRPSDMPEVLIDFARHPYASGSEDMTRTHRRHEDHIREILAILRTRTQQDFTGYKKPTLLRRVQRRMSLNRVEQISDYANILRRSPVEVSALADDILIHVTGFFRDAQAWDALKQKVVTPLVESRAINSPVRCWVTACSSGEEAYSLAILLIEECERLDKALDIKIFATDTAERTLANARNGIFPGGIEAELAPERLERFFQREDAVYRVRQDVRERVVFAPQNALRDPPFSRLDIITCRNLLIYLEPEVQQRLLALLHFGLREGGVLFLGTSETIAGAEGLFETVDKKARIYRRIGATRHALTEFPVPRMRAAAAHALDLERGVSPTVAQLTNRALLTHHVPSAVTVDREHRAIYFHGKTSPYLSQPPGQPTRELSSIVSPPLRGLVRAVLQRAAISHSVEMETQQWIELAGVPRRIIVTASPVNTRGAPELFVVSFQEVDEPPLPAEAGGDRSHAEQELGRIRTELESTIEELQASNEEHKAASEEVMSINEELQSSNEELETSKEEMQSLNEELTTVNAQLAAKMEELQQANNALSALLSSTDIAVIFLDRQFHIRRYTPASRSVAQMIGTDVGRPLKDLASRFVDDDLLGDAQLVLERLTPIEKEVGGELDRCYLRKILPYRSVDNRIDGVVLTYIDISERKRSEDLLRKSEGQLTLDLRIAARLNEVTNRVLAATDTPTALLEILRSAVELLSADGGDIQLLEEHGGELRPVAALGFDPGVAERASAENRPWLKALRSQQRIQFTDTSTTPLDPSAVPGGFRAVISTPLRTRRGVCLGVLTVCFRLPFMPPERDLRLLDQFATQASDLIERLRTEEMLGRLLQTEQSTRRALDQSVHMKDEFLATLSHELRTPLNVIMLWSRVLRDAPDDGHKADAVDAIVRAAEVQHRLIEDMLDSTRIAAGKLRLELRETDLASIVHSAADAIRQTAESKGVRLELEVGPVGLVMADAERLHQVLWNLLNNAVKFTPSGGSVRTEVRQIEGLAEIRVVDTGVGIAPDFLPLMFDRFRQAEQTRRSPGSGLGLGLAISRQLVELHGGSIHASSEGLDKGATITVRLPTSEPIALKAPKPDLDSASRPLELSLDGVRLLLVEDEPQTQEVVRFLLSQSGAIVTAVGSAEPALEAYQRSRPDAIVSDIGLPDFDGYELLRRIRAFEHAQKVPPVPAVALTAYARVEDRVKALSAGYQMHVAKPVSPAELVTVVASLGNSHRPSRFP